MVIGTHDRAVCCKARLDQNTVCIDLFLSSSGNIVKYLKYLTVVEAEHWAAGDVSVSRSPKTYNVQSGQCRPLVLFRKEE